MWRAILWRERGKGSCEREGTNRELAISPKPTLTRTHSASMSETQGIKESIGSIALIFGRLEDALRDLIRVAFSPRADIAEVLFGEAGFDHRLEVLQKLAAGGAFRDDVDPARIIDLAKRAAKLDRQRASYLRAAIVWQGNPTRSELVEIGRDSGGNLTLDHIDIDQLSRLTSDLSDLRADVVELVTLVESTSVVDLTGVVEPDTPLGDQLN